ncbi:MAG TPA: TIM-barrel domain-containing protein [Verrucomicrobiae bacterium]|nr:TIM-barrel domain-containing protein [Verrucomicrobiae bacterium]
MTDSIWFGFRTTNWSRNLKTVFKTLALAAITSGCIEAAIPKLLASDDFVIGRVRVQMLSDSLVRLELKGPKGFEDRPTFHVVNRDWPGVSSTSNLVSGEVILTTPNYVVHVRERGTSLAGTYVTSASGEVLYKFNGALNNSAWLPAPSDSPKVFSFADTPRMIPPPGGVVPVSADAPFAGTSGWDTGNDAADIYVFVPSGNYTQLRKDFLKLTGPTEMIPLYAFGSWDSRWYDYDEASALAQIEEYRSRRIPLDVLVCDTGWRLGASTGYQPNTNLFPDLPRFFSEAHSKNVRVMFNDHPEPVATKALSPEEVRFRYTALTELLDDGLDIWWYDRNWGVSLLSPSPKLRHEVWGMAIFHDATKAAKPSLRPMLMANIDGIDNGVRNRPPNVAAHRYSIQWTGDIGPSMTYLKYAVENAVHSGVASLFAYESDDLGGHVSDPSSRDYVRWMEYGAFSPIYRPHCTHNLTRMPWTFGAEAERISRRFINLRYRLLPLFYAAARENFDSGEPILRRLDLDYPQFPEAKREDQYLLGPSLLVAPMISDGSTKVPSSWLTTTNGKPGLNAEYFSNPELKGAPAFTRIDEKIDFDWHSGSPGESVSAMDWSARWTGNITVPSDAGEVTLAVLADDGIRVWINGELQINNWGPNDSVTTESSVALKPGKTYALRIEYLQLGGNDIVALKWRGPDSSRTVWLPPGDWINAWTGTMLKGPATISETVPLDRLPLYIRSGSIFALAPEMQFTGERPWSPITLDVYPNTAETNQTSLYEDDTLTTAYKAGEFRTTALTTWADDSNKTVSVSIAPAQGSFSGALSQRSWIVRWHRPPNWPSDLKPVKVTVNGQSVGPIVHRAKSETAMPLGSESGAPDGDVFEVTLPENSVLTSQLVIATFGTEPAGSTDK